jgi:hypothetical protein
MKSRDFPTALRADPSARAVRMKNRTARGASAAMRALSMAMPSREVPSGHSPNDREAIPSDTRRSITAVAQSQEPRVLSFDEER